MFEGEVPPETVKVFFDEYVTDLCEQEAKAMSKVMEFIEWDGDITEHRVTDE